MVIAAQCQLVVLLRGNRLFSQSQGQDVCCHGLNRRYWAAHRNQLGQGRGKRDSSWQVFQWLSSSARLATFPLFEHWLERLVTEHGTHPVDTVDFLITPQLLSKAWLCCLQCNSIAHAHCYGQQDYQEPVHAAKQHHVGKVAPI